MSEENNRRFAIELEFIQCLANPWYLNRMCLIYFQNSILKYLILILLDYRFSTTTIL